MDRDERIVEAFRTKKVLSRSEIIERSGLTSGRVSLGLRQLIKSGVISQIRKYGPFSLHENEGQLVDEKRRYLSEHKSSISYEDRIYHTELLKREVIEPWLGQLPHTSNLGIYPNDLPIFSSSNNSLSFPVESNDLFEDFRNHVSIKSNPFDTWKEIKELISEYWNYREKALTSLKIIVNAEFSDLNITVEAWPSRNIVKETGIITEYLPEHLLLEALSTLSGKENSYTKTYLPIKSRIDEWHYSNKKYYNYSTFGSVMIITPKNINITDIKEKIDNKILSLVDDAGNENIKKEASDVKHHIIEVQSRLTKLRTVLKKYSHARTFEGECDYLIQG